VLYAGQEVSTTFISGQKWLPEADKLLASGRVESLMLKAKGGRMKAEN
jgi:hypothetical protein